jgi:hypothetical protein
MQVNRFPGKKLGAVTTNGSQPFSGETSRPHPTPVKRIRLPAKTAAEIVFIV